MHGNTGFHFYNELTYNVTNGTLLLLAVYGKVRIVRDCGYITDERDDKECVKRSGTHDVQVHYCSCTSSECNSGRTLLSSFQLTAAAVLILIALFSTTRGHVNIA